ncbi:MAG: hypothetical protein LUD69_00235 [Oscillospiraceae bacterium]|nr:hypothetical protein [Oscillospiraceae bacterium]
MQRKDLIPMKLKKISSLVAVVLALAMLTVAASAATTTASVESKAAPTVSAAKDSSGNSLTLTVTAVSAASDSSTDSTVAANLTAAYEEVKNASSLTDVASDFATVLAKVNSSLSVSDMVVRDLFDISLPEGTTVSGSITISLSVDIDDDATVLLLHWPSDGDCEVIVPDSLSSGVLTFTVDSLSPFAIVVDSASTSSSTTSSTTNSTSPQTGESISGVALIAAAGFLGLAVVFGTLSYKRKVG